MYLIAVFVLLLFFSLPNKGRASTEYSQGYVGEAMEFGGNNGNHAQGYYSCTEATCNSFPFSTVFVDVSALANPITTLRLKRVSGNSCFGLHTSGAYFGDNTGSGTFSGVNTRSVDPNGNFCDYNLNNSVTTGTLAVIFATYSGVTFDGSSYNPGATFDGSNSRVQSGGPAFQLCSSFACDNDFPTSTPPAVFTVTSNIATSTIWHGPATYIVSGTVVINSGVTLTVAPGTVVKFDTATTSGLTVNGTLDSEASSASSTFFTSLKDDLIGGDTNSDGASTTPAAANWGGVTINSGGRAIFGRSVIRYGGLSTPMIYNNGGYLSIATSSTVAYGNTYGIKTDSGTTVVDNSDVAFNDYALYLSGGTISITSTSTIHNNSLYGAFNNTGATSSFSAQNNYWGTSTAATTTGPYNPGQNPSGTGDRVSDYIDFDPWVGKTGTTSLPHHVISGSTAIEPGSCRAPYIASTTYSSELSSAVGTWNMFPTSIKLTSTTSVSIWNTEISDANEPGASWKGQTEQGSGMATSTIVLNSYYLDSSDSNAIQNTITHELGHILGLDHSYTGNIMYAFQSEQTNLGPQDTSDYEYLWNNVCP